MNKKNIILTFIFIILVLGVGVFCYFKLGKIKDNNDNKDNKDNNNNQVVDNQNKFVGIRLEDATYKVTYEKKDNIIYFYKDGIEVNKYVCERSVCDTTREIYGGSVQLNNTYVNKIVIYDGSLADSTSTHDKKIIFFDIDKGILNTYVNYYTVYNISDSYIYMGKIGDKTDALIVNYSGDIIKNSKDKNFVLNCYEGCFLNTNSFDIDNDYIVTIKSGKYGIEKITSDEVILDNIYEDIVFNDYDKFMSYSYDAPSANAGSPNETCAGSNGDYYTHPAFTFGSDNVRGFWMGKFELTGSSSELTILPSVYALRNMFLSAYNTSVQNMQEADNIYGLNTSRLNTDSHIITNMEWGAAAYLTHSKYGRCTNGSCTTVSINNCSYCKTGVGARNGNESNSTTTCTSSANQYNGTIGILASTTSNITGIYDMSGGCYEYVMGNVSNTHDSYVFSRGVSGFSNDWYNDNNLKYLTPYAYAHAYEGQTAYNRSRLGDATGEVILNASATWYVQEATFAYSSNPWFGRSGNCEDSTHAGIFSFNNILYGMSAGLYTSRAVLVSLK